MWLVPIDTARLTIELNPGCYTIPWYYREPDLVKLMWLLRAGLPNVRYAARLPLAAACQLSAQALHEDSLLVVDIGERQRGELLDSERVALDRPASGRLFIRMSDDDGAGHGWLEQNVKRAVVDALADSFADPAHPLHQLGIDRFPVLDVAELVADPVLLLDVVENAVSHRMAYARQGVHAADYERSVLQGAGKLMVERLRRLSEDDAVAGLRLLLGREFDGPDGRGEAAVAIGAHADPAVRQGAGALHSIGMGRLAGGDFVWQSLARFIDRPTVFAGLDIALADWPAVRGPVSALLRERRPPQEQALAMADSSVSASPGTLHRWSRVVQILSEKLAGAQAGEHIVEALDLLGALMRRAASHLEPTPDADERLPAVLRALQNIATVNATEYSPWIESLQLLLKFYGGPISERAASERDVHARLEVCLGPFVAEHARIMAVVRADIAYALLVRPRSSDDLKRAGEIAAAMLVSCHDLGDDEGQSVAHCALGDSAEAVGDYDRALDNYQAARSLAEAAGSDYLRADAMARIANILQDRGELDEALRIRRGEVLPVFERLGDVRSRAVILAQMADILQARGELDEALRIFRNKVLPVFERLGDVRSHALTLGRVAGILQVRGELDEALRIRRDQELPVYERLGDVGLCAVTLGRIAGILNARGEFDEALRIRRDQELPMYERLGDVRETLVAQANLAMTHLRRAAAPDIVEARRLLRVARSSAERLQLPEANQIRAVQAKRGWEGDNDSDDGL